MKLRSFKGFELSGRTGNKSSSKIIAAFWTITCALTASVGLPASAQTLPASQFYTAQVYGTRIGAFGGPFAAEGMGDTAQNRSASGSDGYGGARADESLGGYVAAEASILIPTAPEETYTSEVYAEATLHYQFYVDGPSDTTLIPVLLLGEGNVFSHGYSGLARAGLSFFHDGYLSSWSSTLDLNQTGNAGFGVNEVFYLQAGHSYWLTTFAQASARRGYIDSYDRLGSTTASVDPTFTIQGEYADLYHFVGLPASAVGGAPVAMVPEPETWALLTAGFSLIGWSMRRRDKLLRR